MEGNWSILTKILKNYPSFFPNFEESKLDYFWSQTFVMTRCYGWSLPSTVLIPLSDFLNHNEDGINHFMVHKKFEKNESLKVQSYFIKKRKVDLSEFNDPQLNKFKPFAQNNETIKQLYIKENNKFVPEENDENKSLLKINYEKLVQDIGKQIYHLSHFETSDEEDNDTGIELKLMTRK